MYGAAMGDLEIAIISNGVYTPIDTISGNQGNQWYFAYYPITAVDSFKIAFIITKKTYMKENQMRKFLINLVMSKMIFEILLMITCLE